MWVPVSAATLTTMAAFLPLMLMPGILGQFMRVVPLVVSVALAISLIEAFWLLPAHVIESRVDPNSPGRLQHWRDALTRRIRHAYTRRLLGVMRHPGIAIGFGGLLAALCLAAVLGGVVKVNFFANDLFRFFYVNVNMPPDTSLAETNATLQRISARIREAVPAEELNNLTTMAGMQLQASLRSRERFWDIRVPKIDSIFDNSLVPRPSWSPGVPPQHRKLVAATHRSPI